MIIAEHLDTLAGNGSDSRALNWQKVTLDLPVEMVLGQDDLIDQVFVFALDILGIVNLELRIREDAAVGRVSQ